MGTNSDLTAGQQTGCQEGVASVEDDHSFTPEGGIAVDYAADAPQDDDCASTGQNSVPLYPGANSNVTQRTSSCEHRAGPDHLESNLTIPSSNDNQESHRGQVILVATGACMLLVSGALLMVLCVLCVKRCRRRSSSRRATSTLNTSLAANGGLQPPVWQPPYFGFAPTSAASVSSSISVKEGSQRHLYIELPDATLALAVKDQPSRTSCHTPSRGYGGLPSPPFLLDPDTLDAPDPRSPPQFPQPIQIHGMGSPFMPIILHPTIGGMPAQPLQMQGSFAAPVPPPLSSHLHTPREFHEVQNAHSDSVYSAAQHDTRAPRSRGSWSLAEPNVDPDLLRRRQSIRHTNRPAHEMLQSCNSDGTADNTAAARVLPSADDAPALGLPADVLQLQPAPHGQASQDASAAIGLPSIAPPADAAAGGALAASLSEHPSPPALGFPAAKCAGAAGGGGEQERHAVSSGASVEVSEVLELDSIRGGRGPVFSDDLAEGKGGLGGATVMGVVQHAPQEPQAVAPADAESALGNSMDAAAEGDRILPGEEVPSPTGPCAESLSSNVDS